MRAVPRRSRGKTVAAVVLLPCAAWGSLAAQDQAAPVDPEPGREVIASTTAGALPPPAEWRCDRVAPEYRAYLDKGGQVEDWRYAGRTYRVAGEEGDTYQWRDWLRWYEAACDSAAPVAADVSATTLPVVIGGVVAGVGVIALLGSGSGSDSPG